MGLLKNPVVFLFISLTLLWFVIDVNCKNLSRVLPKRALQKSHEKSQSEKWQDAFSDTTIRFDQTLSLVNLLKKVAREYLAGCTAIILYDNFTESSDDLLLEKLFKNFPISYIHGQITDRNEIKVDKLLNTKNTCMSYIVFMKDVMRCKSVIGDQNYDKVIVVARSSQWRVYEFLASEFSQSFVNLLVIAKSEKIASVQEELPYILYTHKLFIDGLGSSTHQILTSWYQGKLTRPNTQLFPSKKINGFAGHRFIVSLAHQPPFVIKRGTDDNDDVHWDGIEYRLVEILSKIYNFTTDFRETKDAELIGAVESVTDIIQKNKANLGIAGLYITEYIISKGDVSLPHSQDCAAFISLTSTALPRYRAIMGPFHWSVWLALTFVYCFAIFPLAFSDKHTLKYLLRKPEEMENMFWYVFGTFTNSFSFVGKNSWSKSDKVATRLLIGFYWLFTIIITACYTGSIIAFVTLPVYPSTVDTVDQLLHGRYQIGMLNKDGWQHRFKNVSDPKSARLLKKVDMVPNVESGLKNTTKAFFWPYAFMGSKEQLDYIVRTNFTTTNKRSLLHISNKCFVPYSVGLIFKKNSIYSRILDRGILNIIQSGLTIKLKNDVEWNMMRSATGKLLAANNFGGALSALNVEDRALTLDDTQGMFLLLAAGFAMGGASLLSEWLGGCVNFCKRRRKGSSSSISSNYRSHNFQTPREKLDSIQHNHSLSMHLGLKCVPDEEYKNEENCVADCIIHNDINGSTSGSEDVENVIDRLFNYDDVFGDENIIDHNKTDEELIDDIPKNKMQ